MSQDRNNFKAGLFVLAGIVVAFVVIIVLADFDRLLTPMQTIETRFTLSDGLKGLKNGAAVTIGGVANGSVTDIADELNEHGVVIAQVVRFTIPAKYKIYENAHLELNVPTIGTNTKLNVRGFGGPLDTATPHGKGWEYEFGVDPPIPGGLATSEMVKGFISELGIKDEQRLRLQNIIKNVDLLISEISDKRTPLAEVITNVQSITGGLREDMPAIREKIKTALTHADEAIVSAKDMLEENRPALKKTVDQAHGALTDVREVIGENRENVKTALASTRDTMANAKDITTTVKEQTIAKVHKALDTANEAVVNIKQTTEDLKGFVTTQRPVLERTVANARLVSDQLKLAAIEIRRSPWRLLYKPTDRELETDNLYDAARSFALAASTLQNTADALDALSKANNGQLEKDDPNLRLILDNLHQTFEKFGSAEKTFWNALDSTPQTGKNAQPVSEK